MTLYQALQDVNKGRIIDNGCNYELIALAKGRYTFELFSGRSITIICNDTPAENARKLENNYYNMITPAEHFDGIRTADYTKEV